MATASVWVVHHVVRRGSDDEDTKLLGVYASAQGADAAVQRFLARPGFRDFPHGFDLDQYHLDQDYWADGF
jgi:hypothetical protein